MHAWLAFARVRAYDIMHDFRETDGRTNKERGQCAHVHEPLFDVALLMYGQTVSKTRVRLAVECSC